MMRTRDTENVDYEECLKILLDENKTYGRRGKLSMAKLTERIINFRFVDFLYKAIFFFLFHSNQNISSETVMEKQHYTMPPNNQIRR